MLRAQGFIETLESRQLLADVASLAIGDTLYFADVVDGKSGLYKSDLDGSNTTLLKTYNSQYFNPHWLTDFNGTLFFAARTGPGDYYGFELWKSDGSPEGTVVVRDIYGGAQGSNPHDLMVLNDHLIFQARNTSRIEAFFTTDGTRDGTVQIITPGVQYGYYGTFSNLQFEGDRFYANLFNNQKDQTERWVSDGSQAGTHIAPAAGWIIGGVLTIFGSNGNDEIQLDSVGGSTNVGINGEDQSFSNTSFSTIVIHALEGDDRVILTDNITQSTTIYGNRGLSTIRGGAGVDHIQGVGDLDGAGGNDYLQGEGTVRGGAGDDELRSPGYSGASLLPTVLDGGDGDDTISGNFYGVTILGGSGDDTLTGSYYDDSIAGGAGNDSIQGDSGNDTLAGDEGADTLSGGLGVDHFVSDPSDTVLDENLIIHRAGYQDVLLTGTTGDDIMRVTLKEGDPQTVVLRVNEQSLEIAASEFGHIAISAGAGHDNIFIAPDVVFDIYACSIDLGEGNDTFVGGAGDDIVTPGAGVDVVDGGGGGNRLVYKNSATAVVKLDVHVNQVVADHATDTYTNIGGIVGSMFADSIYIDARVDSLRYVSGEDGDDVITVRATTPSDPGTIYSGQGADTLTGSDADAISADPNDLVIRDNSTPPPSSPPPATTVSPFSFEKGILRINGTSGADGILVRLKPGDATKLQAFLGKMSQTYRLRDVQSIVCDAGEGDDRIDLNGIRPSAKLYAGDGNDTIIGGSGADRIYGGEGNDWIGGFGGNDILYGEAGNDRIFGGDGRDYIVGGLGADVIRGESGVDQFLAKAGEDDFRGNIGDLILFV